MSEPPTPISERVEKNTSSVSSEVPAHCASRLNSEPVDSGPIGSGADSAPKPHRPAPAETVSTLADEPGSAPEERLGETIADAGGALPADSTESATFQLEPGQLADSSPDAEECAAAPRVAHVAGYTILRMLGPGGWGSCTRPVSAGSSESSRSR